MSLVSIRPVVIDNLLYAALVLVFAWIMLAKADLIAHIVAGMSRSTDRPFRCSRDCGHTSVGSESNGGVVMKRFESKKQMEHLRKTMFRRLLSRHS